MDFEESFQDSSKNKPFRAYFYIKDLKTFKFFQSFKIEKIKIFKYFIENSKIHF